MTDRWRPKPADKIVRPRRIKPFRLRRVLGIPGLFSIGYGDVGSSIYYALGVTAMVALGATPIALGIAGLVYLFNALTYAEGAAMIPEGGGSPSYSRHAFNELAGFASGWLLMLTYVVVVAIAAYTVPPYLGYFWPVLAEPVPGTLLSIGIIGVLMMGNVLGAGEWSGFNFLFVTVDIVAQVALIVLGLVFITLVNPARLISNMFGSGNWPTPGNFIFGIAIAALCFTGVESVAQHSEETRRPERRVPIAYVLMVVTVLLLFAGISLVALSAMSPQELGNATTGWARNPMAGVARAVAGAMIPDSILQGVSSPSLRDLLTRLMVNLRDILPGFIAVIASITLLMATNTGIVGMARLSYGLSKNRQLPESLGRIHERLRTPHLAIMVFSGVSALLLLPGLRGGAFFSELAALYVFGSLLVFAAAHASILRLRVTHAEAPRPFKILLNVRVRGHEFPVTAILGLVSTAVIWWIVVVMQPYSWWVGMVWLLTGIGIYYYYRKSRGMSIMKRFDEAKPRRTEMH